MQWLGYLFKANRAELETQMSSICVLAPPPTKRGFGVKISNAGCFGRFGACCRLRNASSMTWKHWVVFCGPLGPSHVLCFLNVWCLSVFYYGDNHRPCLIWFCVIPSQGEQVRILAKVTGLQPKAQHGFHMCEVELPTALCVAPVATAADAEASPATAAESKSRCGSDCEGLICTLLDFQIMSAF
jgi:hypothetical protein